MKKYFIFLISIFTIFLFNNNVYASTFTEGVDIGNQANANAVGTLVEWVYDNTLGVIDSSNIKIASYDNSISIFDKYGYDINIINNCTYNIYYDPSTNVVSRENKSGRVKLCSNNDSISLDNIKKYFKYYIHISYKDIENRKYDTYLIFTNQPYLKKMNLGGMVRGFLVDSSGDSSKLQGMIIRNWNKDTSLSRKVDNVCADTHFGSYVIASGNGGWNTDTTIEGFYNKDIQAYESSNPYGNRVFGDYNSSFDILNLMNYKSECVDIKVESNFKLINYDNANEVYLENTDGFRFGTDTNLSLNYLEVLYLVPKKNIPFNTTFWSDSNFQYERFYHNGTRKYYNELYGLTDISYAALNEYTWFNWDISFSQEDLDNNVGMKITNNNKERTLNIKISSSDFYYKIINSANDTFYVGSLNYNENYNNDFENSRDIARNTEIHNVFTFDNQNSADSFLRSIPNRLKSFGKSFSFLGLMITTFFTFISTELGAYLTILFGFMLIMLILAIMK